MKYRQHSVSKLSHPRKTAGTKGTLSSLLLLIIVLIASLVQQTQCVSLNSFGRSNASLHLPSSTQKQQLAMVDQSESDSEANDAAETSDGTVEETASQDVDSADTSSQETSTGLSSDDGSSDDSVDSVVEHQDEALIHMDEAITLTGNYSADIEQFVVDANMTQVLEDQQGAQQLQQHAKELQQEVDDMVKQKEQTDQELAQLQVLSVTQKSDDDDQLVQLYMSLCNDQVKCHDEDFYKDRLAQYNTKSQRGWLNPQILAKYTQKLLDETTNASEEQISQVVEQITLS